MTRLEPLPTSVPALAQTRPDESEPGKGGASELRPGRDRDASEPRVGNRVSGILGRIVHQVYFSLAETVLLGRDWEPNVAGAGFHRDRQASGRRSGGERCGPDVRVLRSDRLIPGLLWRT